MTDAEAAPRLDGVCLRRGPEIRKSTRGTRTPPLTVIARSPCDEAIQRPRAVAPGLLRCARNDGGVDATIIGHRMRRCPIIGESTRPAASNRHCERAEAIHGSAAA